MPLTPVEIRHVELRRGLFGYKRAAVTRLMDDIADSFEAVWRERADLAERCEALETELNRHAELESLLRSTLVSAERASQELKDQARRESDVIVAEANSEARRLMRDAITEKEQLLGEVRRVRAILRSALEVVAETEPREGSDGGTTRGEVARPSQPPPGTGLVPQPVTAQEKATGAAALPPRPSGDTPAAAAKPAVDEHTDPGLKKLAG